jgi:hypothetical protein
MIESIIVEKREKIKDGFYDMSEDHEKDLLTLMLETESSEGYSMTNDKKRCKNKNCVASSNLIV